MKLNALSEAVMWLPGFGPGEDPLSISPAPSVEQVAAPIPAEVIAAPRTSLHVPVRPAPLPKVVWDSLDASVFSGIGGEVGKFEANLAAIELLRELEAGDRQPTAEERVTLNRFTGWGGIPAAFDESAWDAGRKARHERVKAMLDADEYEAAKASTLNAHYTPHDVVAATWAAVQQMGFKGGRILEPAAGTGYFIGAMPREIALASTVTAVELEPVSARIAKALYAPFGVRVMNQGFQDAKLAEGFYDLVIGNVPFGNYQVTETRNVPYRNFLIHDYFIARAMDLVRPGGIVAVITSAGTLDKHQSTVRAYLASKAELVGAIRLPRSAFKEIAGTEVTTDVLLFQRRESDDATVAPEWAKAPLAITPGGPLAGASVGSSWNLQAAINPHYVANPDAVIGKVEMLRSAHGYASCVVYDGDDLASELSQRVAQLPVIYTPRAGSHAAPALELTGREYVVASADFVKPGAYVVVDGKVAVSEGHTLRIIEDTLQKAKATRIKALIPVRDAVRKLVATQAATEDDDKVAVYRLALMAAYDSFVAKHGFIHQVMNTRAFRDDPDFPLLLSLERWDEETQQAEKADIFHRRTVGAYRKAERCETPEEALLTSLAETSQVVPSRIAELLELEVEDAMAVLLDRGLVFIDPATGHHVERSAYLSGNVRVKLVQAEEAGPEFRSNAEALTAVIPPDLAPHEIGARLGVTWVPVMDYSAFALETFGNAPDFNYCTKAGAWSVGKNYSYTVNATQTWGTSRVDAYTLLEYALNQQTPKVTDIDPSDPDRKKRVVNTVETVAAREKLEAIKEAFLTWLWKDPERTDRLVRSYNDQFNSIAERKFDGSHLTLPGFSLAYRLHAHQKDVIWRAVSSGVNTLMAHVVGAGKTLSMICAGMEMRRTGLAGKPAYVVPNHMLEQFAAEFLRAYPTANVLLASKEDMAPDRRKLILSRIATGDWDAVVITHASFEKIELGKDYVANHIKQVVAEFAMAIRAAETGRGTGVVKHLERQKRMWEARLTKLATGKATDDLLMFDELGVDALFVDEAHLFKNLYRHTKMRVAGLPTNDSMRAFDMHLKTRYIMEKRGEQNGVVFATGTPIANSVAELWVMQHYLQPKTLKRLGLDQFDAWASNFGEEVTALELSPDGSSYRMHTRFARFINVPELMAIFKEVADIRTADMIKLPVPEAIRETVVSPGSDTLREYVAELVERAEAIRNGEVKPSEDNMLAVTMDGRKAATDVRLAGFGDDVADSKVNLCVQKVREVWAKTQSTRGTQIVFLDQSTPGNHWSLYEDMRSKLCKDGIPYDQIAFVHDAGTDAAKEALFKSVREGRVRILFGSSAKMGVGTNVQTRLVALHHLDAPWRPADVEQREGRIIRQGNLNPTAWVYRYVTEGSFDSYVWQTLETKAKFIAQVMAGDTSVRSIEDAELASLSYAEVKALASGNPLIIEKAGVDAEVMKLTMLRARWEDQQWRNRRELADLPIRIRNLRERIARMETDKAGITSTAGDAFVMDFDGKRVTDRELAGKQIQAFAASVRAHQRKVVGRIGGLTLEMDGGRSLISPVFMYLVGQETYEVGEVSKSALGNVRKIEHCLSHGISDDLALAQAGLARREATLEATQGVLDAPFEHAVRLTALLARKAVIDRELGIHEGDKGAVDEVEVAAAA